MLCVRQTGSYRQVLLHKVTILNPHVVISCDHCPYFSGAVETRIYENGVLQGKAVKQSSSGEVEERQYVDGKLNGKATVLYSDSSKEMRTYKVRIILISSCLQISFHHYNVNPTFQDNKLTGPASLFSASGERIEFEYVDGVVHGAAKIKVNIFKI